MSENQEPTMEEILASIRRIISEDDVPAEPVAEAAPPPPPAPPPPAPEAEPPKAAPPPPEPVTFAAPADDPAPLVFDDDVLELTDRLDDPLDLPEALAMSDLELVEPAPPPPPMRAAPIAASDALVGNIAAGAAASAFDKLERTVMMPVGDRSLEDVVREMLRPMLKAWLDENLPAIVEAQVQAEVERIARQRR